MRLEEKVPNISISYTRNVSLNSNHIPTYSTELRKSLCKTYLSRTQAGPGRAVKEQHKQTSPNHVQGLFLSYVQGISERWAPGCVKMRLKSCVLLTAVGKQNATFSPAGAAERCSISSLRQSVSVSSQIEQGIFKSNCNIQS